MKLDETTDAFWVLYLINVLQPVNRDELEGQTRRLMEAVQHKAAARFDIAQSLSALVGAHMAILEADGRYAVTALGLQKLSLFNLGLARDKNRMFMLKNRFRR
jgi:hypothetical protein